MSSCSSEFERLRENSISRDELWQDPDFPRQPVQRVLSSETAVQFRLEKAKGELICTFFSQPTAQPTEWKFQFITITLESNEYQGSC